MSKIYLVKIRRLLVDMFIGVHEHEKRSKQRVAIDVELELDYPAEGFSKGIYKLSLIHISEPTRPERIG